MNSYETNIGKVDNSVFAIGDNAHARAGTDRQDLDRIAEAVQAVLGIASRYSDPAAVQLAGLSVVASRQIEAGQPERDVLKRLVEAARGMLSKLGPALIEAGALAEAVSKISELTRHL